MASKQLRIRMLHCSKIQGVSEKHDVNIKSSPNTDGDLLSIGNILLYST